MDPRALVLGLAVTGVLASSCASSDTGRRAPESFGPKTVDAVRGASCDTDKRQVETALVAHYALLGYDATTMSDLLQFGVDNEPDRWTLQIAAGNTEPTVVATVGGFCDS